MRLPWGAIQRLGAVALVLLSAAFFCVRCTTSNEIPFVFQSAEAPWIMPPSQVAANLEQWGREDVPVASFIRSIAVNAPNTAATLHLRALRGFEVFVNGEALPGGSDDGARWRDERSLDLSPRLRAGWNEIRIDVSNAHGPPLLSLSIEGLEEPVVSDPTWWVAQEGRTLGPAILADDTRINPGALAVGTPAAAIAARHDTVLLLFMLGVIVFLAGRRFASDRVVTALPSLVLGVACVAWVVLFWDKFIRIPIEIGFDARHHKFYVDFLRESHALPIATGGWSVYHPPLFYASAAVFEWIGDWIGGRKGEIVALKLIPFVAGLANVWIAAELCRRLFPNDSRRRFATAVFAGVLPMNIYAAAYFSNETIHAALAGLAVLATVDILLTPRARIREALVLGFLLGLALLTKYTAVLVAALALFFTAVKLAAVERATPARLAQLLGVCAALPLLLAGWFYLRNAILFGDPLMANWGSMPGRTLRWWQQPGFHTAAYYLGFGESLIHPYLSAFHSFWDSLYSTLWGDGGIAGRVNPAQRHPAWNYDFMSITYLVAIPASLLAAAGAVRCVAVALGDEDPRRRAAFSFLTTLSYTVVFGLMYMSLRLPFFAQAKATYGLIAMSPLALFFADGLARCDEALARRGWLPARVILYGWFALFASACFLSYAG